MNVFFGGTLYQDIPTQFETLTLHKGTNYDQNIHTIDIEESTYLFDINNEKSQGTVNSIHHQGVKAIGKSLNIIAKDSQDNLAEAFYSEEYETGKVMGVQWHPELIPGCPLSQTLFEELANAARDRMQAKAVGSGGHAAALLAAQAATPSASITPAG